MPSPNEVDRAVESAWVYGFVNGAAFICGLLIGGVLFAWFVSSVI